MLRLRLLGTPAFQLKDETLSHLITGKMAALLSYLAVTGQPQPRTQLTDLLWENTTEQQTRTNLRYLLSNLRKILGDYVIAQGETITLNQELPYWVDATTFTQHMTIAAAPSAAALDPEILQELLNLYKGEFLAGFQTEELPVFERWMLAQRRHLHDLLVQGLQLRTQQHLTQGEYAEGLALNHYLLTLEPWREEAHRQRMLLFAHSGQRSAALQQYSRCCQLLAEELDVPPMPQTTSLYEQIKSGQWFATQQIAMERQHLPIAITSFPESLSTSRYPLPQQQNGTTGNGAHSNGTLTNGTLPNGALTNGSLTNGSYPHDIHPHDTHPHDTAELTSVNAVHKTLRSDLGAMPESAQFYGRKNELATLHSWIGQEHNRLIALLGIAGQGKTALAAAFVQDIMDADQNPVQGFTQVIWLSLQGAPPCIETLHEWLRQLEGTQNSTQSGSFDQLITRLFAILKVRRCLLVLDGLEAILSDAGCEEKNDDAYRPGCKAYDALIRLFFQRRHRSCLLLTSQVRTEALNHLDERNGAFRSLELAGLTVADGAALLASQRVATNSSNHEQLHQHYAGNPLLLCQSANLLHELFGGDVDAFLQEELFFMGDIGSALTRQLARLTPLERQVLQQLAQAEQPLSRQALYVQLPSAPSKPEYFQALQNLQRSFLLRQAGDHVALLSVLKTYLIEQMRRRIQNQLSAVVVR